MPIKKSNPNRVSKKPTTNLAKQEVKNSPWLEDYRDLFTFSMRPITEAFIERFSKELVEWSKLDDSLTITSFCRSKGISRTTFYSWVHKYPEIKEAYEFAYEQLGDKREVGGLTRKLDPTFAWNSLAKYDPEWKEFMQWKANLKQEHDNQQKVVVEINDLSNKDSK